MKDRRLSSPTSSKVRPTTDKVRSSIFSILGSMVDEACVLDVFAGTGALGIESYSRGAKEVVFLDKDVQEIKLNINLIPKGFLYKINRGDYFSFKFMEKGFDIIFIDPPYGVYEPKDVLEVVYKKALLSLGGVVVYEEFYKTPFNPGDKFIITDERKYGDTAVRFLELHV